LQNSWLLFGCAMLTNLKLRLNHIAQAYTETCTITKGEKKIEQKQDSYSDRRAYAINYDYSTCCFANC
jgi:hypothetical protein